MVVGAEVDIPFGMGGSVFSLGLSLMILHHLVNCSTIWMWSI